MSDTSAFERKFLPGRRKPNTTTEGRKPQLSALLSEISADSINEQMILSFRQLKSGREVQNLSCSKLMLKKQTTVRGRN